MVKYTYYDYLYVNTNDDLKNLDQLREFALAKGKFSSSEIDKAYKTLSDAKKREQYNDKIIDEFAKFNKCENVPRSQRAVIRSHYFTGNEKSPRGLGLCPIFVGQGEKVLGKDGKSYTKVKKMIKAKGMDMIVYDHNWKLSSKVKSGDVVKKRGGKAKVAAKLLNNQEKAIINDIISNKTIARDRVRILRKVEEDKKLLPEEKKSIEKIATKGMFSKQEQRVLQKISVKAKEVKKATPKKPQIKKQPVPRKRKTPQPRKPKTPKKRKTPQPRKPKTPKKRKTPKRVSSTKPKKRSATKSKKISVNFVKDQLVKNGSCSLEMKKYDFTEYSKQLGKGSYGTVFEACQRDKTCDWVLKIVKLEGFSKKKKKDDDDDVTEEDFQQEAVLSKLFGDEGLAPKVKAYFICEKQGFMISERFDGSLNTLVDKSKTIHNHILDIGRQIKSLVKKFHKLGFIHFDLALRNVLYRKEKDGNYKVVLNDFGMTRSYNMYEGMSNTRYFQLNQTVMIADGIPIGAKVIGSKNVILLRDIASGHLYDNYFLIQTIFRLMGIKINEETFRPYGLYLEKKDGEEKIPSKVFAEWKNEHYAKYNAFKEKEKRFKGLQIYDTFLPKAFDFLEKYL